MRWFLRNCTYTESHSPEHTYTFTGRCVVTGEEHSVTVKGKDLFDYNRGAFIQDAFPYLTPGDREFLNSGISPKGWKETFGICDSHLESCDDDGYCNNCGEQ